MAFGASLILNGEVNGQFVKDSASHIANSVESFFTQDPRQAGQQIGNALITTTLIAAPFAQSSAGSLTTTTNLRAAPASTHFFGGTTYTQKVTHQMTREGVGGLHAFPESVRAFERSGTISKIIGGDGKIYQQLNIPQVLPRCGPPPRGQHARQSAHDLYSRQRLHARGGRLP